MQREKCTANMSDTENNVVEQDTEGDMEEENPMEEESEPQEEDETDADKSMESTSSPASSPTKSPAKSPKKTPQKKKADQNGEGEAKDEVDEEEEEEEESSDEELVGLLDGPVKLMTGKRERKKTERLTFDTKKEVVDSKFEVEEGRGTRLGDIPNIEFHISRTNSENFRALYRFFFSRTGKVHEIKKNLRKFSGFNFDKDSPQFSKKEAVLVRYTMEGLKEVCMWLDLDKSGNKEAVLERILEFCLEPKPSGRPHPQRKGRPKSAQKKSTKKKAKKRKREDGSADAKKSKKAKKAKKSSDDVNEDEEAEEDEVEEEEEEEEEEEGEEEGAELAEREEGDDDDDFEEPKKKKAKLDKPTPKKKVEKKKKEKKKEAAKSPQKSPKKSPAKKATPKKTPTKKTTPKKKASIQITPKSKSKYKPLTIDDSDDSSDDEPLIRKAEPSEAQIEQTIKSFLEKADLELVTMKMVCKKVYSTYPDFNLAHKKDFIKATVRSIIS